MLLSQPLHKPLQTIPVHMVTDVLQLLREVPGGLMYAPRFGFLRCCLRGLQQGRQILAHIGMRQEPIQRHDLLERQVPVQRHVVVLCVERFGDPRGHRRHEPLVPEALDFLALLLRRSPTVRLGVWLARRLRQEGFIRLEVDHEFRQPLR